MEDMLGNATDLETRLEQLLKETPLCDCGGELRKYLHPQADEVTHRCVDCFKSYKE